MKHKGNRDIPDFSKKRAPGAPAAPGAAGTNSPDAKQKVARPQPVKAKPQSKSAKSGQRGR